jgi:hypothetical protein
MAAGSSAMREAQRSRLRAAQYGRQLEIELSRAKGFDIAGRTEARVAASLAAMAGWGWHLLPDRRWPGTRSANIDLLHVGPGGVLVVDVKCWAEPDIVDGRLYRGQADASDELEKMTRVTELVTDAVAELGLAPSEVLPIMVFVNQCKTSTALGRVRIVDEHSLVPLAVERGQRISPEQVGRLVRLLEQRFPACDEPDSARGTAPLVIPEPVLPIARHRHQHQQEPMLFDAEALEAAELNQALRAPIEEWMTFLHPDQVRLIRRIGAGPTRIRGAAGTGKTVVALHRAAYLAESSRRPILFTSFIKTLPPTLASLYRRLSPGTADQVEFTSLHRWASRLLSERGIQTRVDQRFLGIAHERAWARQGQGSALEDVGVGRDYWRDEITYVIKGRGITEFEDYATLRRVGRRTRLPAALREIVWSMYVEYESQLRSASVIDFDDQISLALASLKVQPLDVAYGAVIADEIQDLSCQALRLLAQIARPEERLLFVGDGQQQIYPGGFTLSEAGISVAGRSMVLRTNYRNAATILSRSATLVAEDEYNDLDEQAERGHREVVTVRSGGQVWETTAPCVEALRAGAIEHVKRLTAGGHSPAGIALLCATNSEAARHRQLLGEARIAAIDLSSYCGNPVEAVKVGTYQRAKGLEFKHVVLPLTSKPRAVASEDARREERERDNRMLFVAMTRARDTLWLGRLG